MKKTKRPPLILLERCQFKSLGKLRLLAKYLAVMEIEFGVGVCQVGILDCFVCPWITDAELKTLNRTPMEAIVRRIIEKSRRRRRHDDD